MGLGIVPKYSNLFPGEKIPDLSTLLKDVPSSMSIGILSFINGSLFLEDTIKAQLFFVAKLLERSPKTSVESFQGSLRKFAKDNELEYFNIFPLFTMLRFIEWEINNYRDIDFIESTPEQEIAVLKAILIFNEELDRQYGEIKPKKIPQELIWPVGLPQFEFSTRTWFLSGFLSSLDLCDYLKQRYPEQYKEYLTFYDVEKIETIFVKVFELFINGHKKETRSYFSHFKTEVLEKNKILKSFNHALSALNAEEYKKEGNDKHFKGMRKWPIVSYGKGFFDIVNWNFLSDKLSTTAIGFDFYYNTSMKDTVKFDQYKADLGLNFSETIQFNKYIELSFPGKTHIRITPDENRNLNVDHYVRNENHICLFEFKDYIMPDKVKNGSYEEIKSYFDTRFIANEKGKKKGISQLATQIESLSRSLQLYEDFKKLGIHKHRMSIFPIIVVTDYSFMISGLEHYLDIEFKKLLPKKHGFYQIHNLTIIELDFFQEYHEILNNGIESLPSLIHRHYLTLETTRSLFRRGNTPGLNVKTMFSFRHTTYPKLKYTDPTKESDFQAIVKRLGIK